MKTIHAISAHAEGEVDDVIVGGVAPPPGDTIRQQRSFIARDETLLVPPKHPDADAACIIMEPEDTPPMSGSNSICVARLNLI